MQQQNSHMQKLTLLAVVLFALGSLHAQTGRISGTILDSKTGETLPGATVLIDGTQRGASADFDGKFAINNVPAGKVVLVVSYISYTTKKISDVLVKSGDVTYVNVQLDASTAGDLAEVEVVVTLNKENNTALVLQQKNAAQVSDGISAETIKRTPDRTTSDVLRRVSGVTIQDDKFVIVRGLNERYNASYLNESPLPSTESDKKAFAFDLFPSNMLDNIIVNKTATPDMPSEFAGGIVRVNTKSIPEKNFVSVSTGLGYNTITTGKDQITYDGGKWDKFGFDDGSRNLPSEVPSLKDKGTWIGNDDQARMATYFKNDWGFKNSNFAPNSTAQLAAGYNFKRKEKDFLGVIFSLGYSSTKTAYNFQRSEYDGLDPAGNSTVIPTMERDYLTSVSQTQNSTGALLNLSCKLNENNSISLKNLLTGTSDNRFFISDGTNNVSEQVKSLNRVTTRYFSANRIFSSQLNSDHYLPAAKIKISWNAGLSAVKRTVPNFRFMSYSRFSDFQDPENPNPSDTVFKAEVGTTLGPGYAGYRVYSALDESIKSSKVDVSRLFKISENLKIEAKAGGFFQFRQRVYTMRSFGMQPYQLSNYDLLMLPEDSLFAQQNLGKGGFKLFEGTKFDDNYNAKSTLGAAYAMTEIKLKDKTRIIGGVRYESYMQKLSVDWNTKDSVYVNSTVNDLLPSVNLVHNFTERLGVRLAWYKTLNRPEFRELAPASWYDPETRLSIAGNTALQRCYIQNFDARFEVYPGRGQLFTVSGFYKYFNSPIERYLLTGQENQITYRNANFGTVYGSELEYRVNMGAILKKDSVRFLSNLTLFANFSLMKSQVDVKGIQEGVSGTRPMQGQAPYLINGGLSYVDNKAHFSVSAMVNRVGQKIYLVGNELIPNRWENARTVIDLQATKTFLKDRLELRFNLKDLLHPDWIVYYNKGGDGPSDRYEKNKDYINFKRNYGSTYSFMLTYKF